MRVSDEDLETAIAGVKKEIQQASLRPDNSLNVNEGNTKMAAKKLTNKTDAPKTDEPKKAAPAVEGYTVAALAEEFKTDGVTLRKCLRDLDAKKPGTRWVWAKKTDPQLVELRPQIKEWLATDGRQGNGRKATAEKEKPAPKADAKKTAAKSTGPKKKKAAASE